MLVFSDDASSGFFLSPRLSPFFFFQIGDTGHSGAADVPIRSTVRNDLLL